MFHLSTCLKDHHRKEESSYLKQGQLQYPGGFHPGAQL